VVAFCVKGKERAVDWRLQDPLASAVSPRRDKQREPPITAMHACFTQTRLFLGAGRVVLNALPVHSKRLWACGDAWLGLRLEIVYAAGRRFVAHTEA
jgi:hypothetical protein